MSDKHILIEQWKIKAAWLALGVDQRQDYVQNTVQGMETIMPLGIRALGWGFVDRVEHGSGYDFWSAWELDSQKAVDAFLAGLKAAGWYDYFEQENITGVALTPPQVFEKIILAGTGAA